MAPNLPRSERAVLRVAGAGPDSARFAGADPDCARFAGASPAGLGFLDRVMDSLRLAGWSDKPEMVAEVTEGGYGEEVTSPAGPRRIETLPKARNDP